MHNSRKHQNVKEDAPRMRSVMLQPSQPRSVFSQPRSVFAAAPSEMPMFAPHIQSKESFKVTDKLENLNKANKDPSTWRVGNLKNLPGIHVLARTHTYISGVTPQQVATRIFSCCKAESIATKFDADRARVQAETIDHVSFIVQLFAEPIACNNGKIIVEMEKTNGCSFRYCEIAKIILNAAEGHDANRAQPASLPSRPLPPMPMRTALPSPMTNRSLPSLPGRSNNDRKLPTLPCRRPLPLLERSLPPVPRSVNISRSRTLLPMQAVRPKKDKLTIVSEDLEFVSMKLQSDRIDTKLIAMETLMQVTSSSDSDCQSFAAEKVFSGPIFDSLMKEIVCGKDEGGFDILCKMRRNALTVFANCLEEVGKSDSAVVKERENVLCDKLLKQLSKDVEDYSTNPHEACRAARCLRSLFQSSSKALSIGSSELNSALLSACRDGGANQEHAMLEKELLQLKEVMI